MIDASGSETFGKWRACFWPVHRDELKRLVPMLFIFFLLAFDYNVLHCMKDALVVTAKNSGAEVIPFIKVWVMFPASIFLTWVFIRLSNRFSRENVFYIMLGSFLIFFFLFAFFLYPKRESVHLHTVADSLALVLPEGCKGLISMIRYWSFSIFYAMAELWSNIVLSMLCWGFANQITKLDEAKRFYGLLGVGINISGIAAGQLSIFAAELSQSKIAPMAAGDSWGPTLEYLITMVVGAGALALLLFAYLNRTLKANPALGPSSDSVAANKGKKPKLSMRENIKYLLSSRYMLCLVAIVVSYNVVINLVEVLWKHEVKELYPNPLSYNLYMNQVTTWIGILATLVSLLVSGNSLRLFGWTPTAMITPAILLITSIGFFGSFFIKDSPELALAFAGISPLTLVVFFGTLQNCCSRAAKYTVFDATKEMVFIPLSSEEKIKGKAAVDGICNRLGKSGGSVIYQFLLVIFTTISACAPYVAIFLFSIIGIWMIAVRSLGKQFMEKVQPQTGSALPSTELATKAVSVSA
jgi:ATP:ADP antiporter, AAA family